MFFVEFLNFRIGDRPGGDFFFHLAVIRRELFNLDASRLLKSRRTGKHGGDVLPGVEIRCDLIVGGVGNLREIIGNGDGGNFQSFRHAELAVIVPEFFGSRRTHGTSISIAILAQDLAFQIFEDSDWLSRSVLRISAKSVCVNLPLVMRLM